MQLYKRYSGNVALFLLLLFTTASLTSQADDGEIKSEPIVSETKLRYFDITTLKYAEDPDLGIPDEYKIPVEAAFELA